MVVVAVVSSFRSLRELEALWGELDDILVALMTAFLAAASAATLAKDSYPGDEYGPRALLSKWQGTGGGVGRL